MIPDCASVQGGSAMALGSNVVPNLALPYAIGTASIAASLLVFMAQENDRAAEWRVQEINRLQDIFEEAAENLPADAFSVTLASAAKDLLTSMSLSYLDSRRREYLPLIVELQGLLELKSEEWAPTLNKKICLHHVKTAESRALFLPQM